MPWVCRMIDPDDTSLKSQVGDMWPCDYWPAKWLSTYYDEHWRGKRPPMMVQLPSGTFCIDMCTMEGGIPHPQRHGWTVTGEPPNVTLSPSINIKGYYHGFIQGGVITEDCEGRKFP